MIGGYFGNFGQVKNWWVFFWLWASRKLTPQQTRLEKTGCLSNFLGYLSMPLAHHPGFSYLWRSPPALSSTLTTFGCLLFWYFRHPVFWFTPFPTQSVRLPLVTYPSLSTTSFTYRMLCHASSHLMFPIQPLPVEQRIPLGVVNILGMCLCSYT